MRSTRAWARRGRLRPAAQELRPGVRDVLRPARLRRDRQEQHALRLHRRRGRPLRRLAAEPGELRRRDHPVHVLLVGEMNANLAGLLATQQNVTTPFTVHSDMAPTIYLTGNPAARRRRRASSAGRSAASRRSTRTRASREQLSAALADPVGMKAIHMVTADAQRTPTLTMFAAPDWFLFAGAPNCTAPCVTVPTTPPTKRSRGTTAASSRRSPTRGSGWSAGRAPKRRRHDLGRPL